MCDVMQWGCVTFSPKLLQRVDTSGGCLVRPYGLTLRAGWRPHRSPRRVPPSSQYARSRDRDTTPSPPRYCAPSDSGARAGARSSFWSILSRARPSLISKAWARGQVKVSEMISSSRRAALRSSKSLPQTGQAIQSNTRNFINTPNPRIQKARHAIFAPADIGLYGATTACSTAGKRDARNCPLKCAASLNARATIVNVGLAWLDVGNVAALEMNRFPIPCTPQLRSTTLVRGSSPIRAVPM